MAVGNVPSTTARQTHVSAVEVVPLTVLEVGRLGLIAMPPVAAEFNSKFSRSRLLHQTEVWIAQQMTMQSYRKIAQLLTVRSTASGTGELGPGVLRRVVAARWYGRLPHRPVLPMVAHLAIQQMETRIPLHVQILHVRRQYTRSPRQQQN